MRPVLVRKARFALAPSGAVVAALALATGCGPKEPGPDPVVQAADVAEWVGRIAADSTRGRDTPSPELDRLAAVVAAEFRDFGLTGDGDSLVQRYELSTRRLMPEASGVEWSRSDSPAGRMAFGPQVGLAQGTVPAAPLRGPVMVLGGAIDPVAIPGDRLRGRVVVWAADFTGPGAARADGIAATLVAGAPAGVIIVPNEAAVAGALLGGQAPERVTPPTPGLVFTALVASESAVAASTPALARAIRAARLQPGTVLDSIGLDATITIVDSAIAGPRRTAPNVFGIRRGDDARLREEYLVVSAHLDHLGVVPGADSIMNGADDNASGAAGVILLARTLSRPGLRLKRSVIFLLVSGEEKGLWGSAYFAEHPPVPLDRIAAVVNIDMIGRGWRDTVGVIGREFSSLGAVLDSVAAAHADLGVVPIGDVWPDQKRFFRSDQYSFARRGVTSLFLSSGYSEDYHAPSDSPDKIDAEKEARLLTLIGHFLVALANREGPFR